MPVSARNEVAGLLTDIGEDSCYSLVLWYTFSNILYKMHKQMDIARRSQLSSLCQPGQAVRSVSGRWYGMSVTVQNTDAGSLSSSEAGQDAVLYQFSTVFGLSGLSRIGGGFTIK